MRKTNINFLKPAKFLTPASIIVSFVALAVIFAFGFSYGIDFVGGNEVQVRFQKTVTSVEIKQALISKGIENPIVQKFGEEEEFLIRVEVVQEEQENNKRLQLLSDTLKNSFEKQGIEIRRMDSIGPQIGKELRRNGILALIYSLLMILIYLGLRFDTKYAPSAVFCLFHDAMITMSIFSIFQSGGECSNLGSYSGNYWLLT